MNPYLKCARKGTQGYAIIWAHRDYDSADTATRFYITFNQRNTPPSVNDESYPNVAWAKGYAHGWLRDQPAKAPPKGFQFVSANPRTVQGETNDCAVRALSLAFNKPYEEIHELCAKIGRPKGRGMKWGEIDLAIGHLTGNMINKMQRLPRAQTFTTFARDHKVGNYVVIKRGHAVALIDGVFHDAGSIGEPRAIVKAVFKVK